VRIDERDVTWTLNDPVSGSSPWEWCFAVEA
jgi:hypothetical protein